MSDCPSVVARDGNNKVNWSRFYHLFILALLWLFEGIKTRGNGELKIIIKL
jgi:hypothetical protein